GVARSGAGRRQRAAGGPARAAAGALGPRREEVAAAAMKPPPLAELEALASNSRERFEQLAARMGGKRTRPAAGPALREEYWRSLRELFTRDVTHAHLSRLLEHGVGETFRFLTREVDTSDLGVLPWWRRYPRASVRLFLAIAYRLSPRGRGRFGASVFGLLSRARGSLP